MFGLRCWVVLLIDLIGISYAQECSEEFEFGFLCCLLLVPGTLSASAQEMASSFSSSFSLALGLLFMLFCG